MVVAVIADTHDNEATLQLALNFFREHPVAALIHCGDITTPETLALVAGQFSQPIHVVFGNVDNDRDGLIAVAKQFPHVTVHGDVGETSIGGVPLAFVHYPEEARRLAENSSPPYAGGGRGGTYRFVFHGHTHKPWEEKIGTCTLLNPGTLAGMFSKATFAVVDLETGQATLKLVERLENSS